MSASGGASANVTQAFWRLRGCSSSSEMMTGVTDLSGTEAATTALVLEEEDQMFDKS